MTGILRLSAILRAAAVALLAGLIVWQLSRSLPTPALLDFGSFWESGAAASRGEDPYAVYPLTFRVVLANFQSVNPNLNPPVALPLLQAFAALPPHEAFRHWWSISAVLYGGLVALLLAARRATRPDAALLLPALWAFALAGFWDTLVLGQIYVPLAVAAAAGWLLLERGRPAAGGLAIGLLAAVKPNFLVWPVLLAISGEWRAALTALATVAVTWGLALAGYGLDVHRDWFAVLGEEPARLGFLTNVSFAGLAHRLGAGSWSAVLGFALLPALALFVLKRRPDPLRTSAIALSAALAASPIAWVHYILFLLPVFLARPRDPLLGVAALALLVPVPWVLGFTDGGILARVTIGSIYGWALALCLASAILDAATWPDGVSTTRKAGAPPRPG